MCHSTERRVNRSFTPRADRHRPRSRPRRPAARAGSRVAGDQHAQPRRACSWPPPASRRRQVAAKRRRRHRPFAVEALRQARSAPRGASAPRSRGCRAAGHRADSGEWGFRRLASRSAAAPRRLAAPRLDARQHEPRAPVRRLVGGGGRGGGGGGRRARRPASSTSARCRCAASRRTAADARRFDCPRARRRGVRRQRRCGWRRRQRAGHRHGDRRRSPRPPAARGQIAAPRAGGG